jgi:hypothetical protein
MLGALAPLGQLSVTKRGIADGYCWRGDEKCGALRHPSRCSGPPLCGVLRPLGWSGVVGRRLIERRRRCSSIFAREISLSGSERSDLLLLARRYDFNSVATLFLPSSRSQMSASSPLRSSKSSSLADGPLGCLSPISHCRTVDTLVLSTEASTAWLIL